MTQGDSQHHLCYNSSERINLATVSPDPRLRRSITQGRGDEMLRPKERRRRQHYFRHQELAPHTPYILCPFPFQFPLPLVLFLLAIPPPSPSPFPSPDSVKLLRLFSFHSLHSIHHLPSCLLFIPRLSKRFRSFTVFLRPMVVFFIHFSSFIHEILFKYERVFPA